MVDGPSPMLCFLQITERKTSRSRVHRDIAVQDQPRESARLRALGASVFREADGYTVMQDPEGNEFCIVPVACGDAAAR